MHIRVEIAIRQWFRDCDGTDLYSNGKHYGKRVCTLVSGWRLDIGFGIAMALISIVIENATERAYAHWCRACDKSLVSGLQWHEFL